MRIIFIFALLLFLSCSIKSPEFTITGQKTNLEQQVLGSYQHLRDDAIVTTSVRTSGDGARVDAQQQVILQAVQNQEFNKDEVNELKRDKVIGENNRGFLEIHPTPKYESDETYRKLVDGLVDVENSDRRVIYQRVLLMSNVTTEEAHDTNAIFATMQMDQSPAGTLIQQPNGEWIEKPKDQK